MFGQANPAVWFVEGREPLNAGVLRHVRRGSAVGPRLAFCANIAVDLRGR